MSNNVRVWPFLTCRKKGLTRSPDAQKIVQPVGAIPQRFFTGDDRYKWTGEVLVHYHKASEERKRWNRSFRDDRAAFLITLNRWNIG